jgi:uncharacterized phage protein (predicted DNA packaging)
MKISEIDISIVKQYLRIDGDDDLLLLPLIMSGAKAYIISYTGIKLDADLDTKEDLSIVYLALISDMYDNRAVTVEKDKVNKIIDTILNMYCINLI